MDESSGDDMILKTEPKPFMIQLKPSLDNSSQNDDDDIYFSTNCLLKLKNDNKSLPNKKKYVIKMVEKKKRNERILFTNKIVETKETENKKKERLDFYGNVIKKKNKKKVKVSFIDNVTSHPLVEYINIESFKNFNYIEGMPKENVKVANAECVCCLIF